MKSSSSSSSPSTLPSTSFEAFHTKQLRQRAREKYEQQLHKNDGDDDDDDNVGGTPMTMIPGYWPCLSWSRTQIGQTLERLEVQSTIVFLIYIDWLVFTLYYIHDMETTCSIFGITGDGDGAGAGDGVGAGMNGGDGILVSKFLASVLNFNMMVFVLEAMFIMYAFGMQCLEHYGYMLDIVLLFAIVYHDLFELDFGIGGIGGIIGDIIGVGVGGIVGGSSSCSPLRFLTLLRVWRMARITSTTLQLQKVKHDDTKEELTALQSKMDRTLLDVKRLKANCTTEGDLRKEVERMLEEYRGEIGVMKEALQIAAMDVVKVAAEAAADGSSTSSSGIGGVVVGGGGEEATRRSGRSRSRHTMMDVEGDTFYDGAE